MDKCGFSATAISQKVKKKDGARPTVRAVRSVILKKKHCPSWRGEDSAAGGRPCAMSKEERKKLYDFVFERRGELTISATLCKRFIPFLRRLDNCTVCRTLRADGLRVRPRRNKRSVPKGWRPLRVAFCDWVLARRRQTLERFAYTDGTTFFLARSGAEHEDKKRAALGPKVWRMADGKDSLWDECVGPSSYAKSQGQPVKIWGMMANGVLHYYLLPADGRRTTNMNGERYKYMIDRFFAQWRRDSFGDDRPVNLVQDHEKCLWKAENVLALRKSGCNLLKNFPKHSPDLNAIEGFWNLLRIRLQDTAPANLESRGSFVTRLRRCVTWLNENKAEQVLRMCNNQKERAKAVKELDGAKCAW